MDNTGETKDSRITPFLKQCFVTGSVCMNVIGHGCVFGFPAVLLPQLHNPRTLIPLTPQAESWIASVISIAMLMGSFVTPSIMDKFGRKIAHYSVTIPILLGWFTMTMAQNVETLVVCRMLHGLSFGMFMPLRSVLVGEYTSPKNRGAFLTTIALAQGVGVFIVHLLGSLLSWQLTSLICAFITFFSLIMITFSPESPSFLAAKGRYDDCRKAFRWLRGHEEDDELEEMIQAQMLMKMGQVKLTSNNIETNDGILVIIKKREFYLPIVVMSHMYFLNQFSGATTLSSFSIKIIEMLMGSQTNVRLWMVVMDIQRLFSSTAAVFLLNKFNRRTMMFFAGLTGLLSHIAIASFVFLKTLKKLYYESVWIPALLINLQLFSVSFGILPLCNVMAGEIFPLEFRSKASSISLVPMTIWMFVVLKTFPILTINLGLHGTYMVYAAFLTYNLVVLWFLLPETRGRTLQQIEDGFRGRPLRPEEAASRMSLKLDPVIVYKRKMSERRCSTALLS